MWLRNRHKFEDEILIELHENCISGRHHIPEHCWDGMYDYIVCGIPTGDFLKAVLTNDLMEACKRADNTNQRKLFDYACYLHNYAPGACFGSEEAFDGWVKKQGLIGLDKLFVEAEGNRDGEPADGCQ